MRPLVHRSWLLTVLLAAACDGSPIDPSRSLVGAKKLPSAQMLARETIQIEREFGGPGAQRLTFQLRPDDKLTIILAAATDPQTQSKTQTFHLSSGIAEDARSNLWRVRPEQQGAGVNLPSDCPPRSAANAPALTVVFTSPTPNARFDNSHRAVFGLPPQSVCNTEKAKEARNLIRSVIHSFPPSNLPAEYSQRKWHSEALIQRSQGRAPQQSRSQD
jgi:hypothetical protein